MTPAEVSVFDSKPLTLVFQPDEAVKTKREKERERYGEKPCRTLRIYTNQVLECSPKEIWYDDGVIAGTFPDGSLFLVEENEVLPAYVTPENTINPAYLPHFQRFRILGQTTQDLLLVKPTDPNTPTLEQRLRGAEGKHLTEIERKLEKLANTHIVHDPLPRVESLTHLLNSLTLLEEQLKDSPFADYRTVQRFKATKEALEGRAKRLIERYNNAQADLERFNKRVHFYFPDDPPAIINLYEFLMRERPPAERDELTALAASGVLLLHGAKIDDKQFYAAASRTQEFLLRDKKTNHQQTARGVEYIMTSINVNHLPKDCPDRNYLEGYFLDANLNIMQDQGWFFTRKDFTKYKILYKNRGFTEYIGSLPGSHEEFTVFAKQLTPAPQPSAADQDHPATSAPTSISYAT